MSRIGVVIPNWNGRHLLPFCLQALAGQEDVELDVVVADNDSRDGSRDWLAREHPSVRVLPLLTNTGFAGAANAGIAACSTEFILLLNNDAAPHRDYVAVLARFLETHLQVAAVQGRILCHADPTRVDSLGIRFDPLWRAFQAAGQEEDPGPSGPSQIAGVTASAALYRASALREVADPGTPAAVFDPRFFAYYEDVDLALRLRRAGWEAWLEAATACEHVGSATGIDGSMSKAYLLGRNYLLYLARHLGPGGLLALMPGLARKRLRRLLTWPLHPRRDTALWAGELAALPHLPAAFRKGSRTRSSAAAAARVPPA